MPLLEVACKFGNAARSFIKPKSKHAESAEQSVPFSPESDQSPSAPVVSEITPHEDISTDVDGQTIDVNGCLHTIFGSDCLHSKRVTSIAYAVVGALHSPTLSISGIGHGMAQARSVNPKHAIKQVDRLLGNEKVEPWQLFPNWVNEVIAGSREISVAMDWTVFHDDAQSTLILSLVLNGGRSIPLIWRSFHQEELKDNMSDIEDSLLRRLKECVSADTKVTILADRGFGSQPVGAVIGVHAKNMKDPWFLAASEAEIESQTALDYYAARWSIETAFRDYKDPRFGMGLGTISTDNPERRDKLILIGAIKIYFLNLLGAASEMENLDRNIQPNTKHDKRMNS